MSEDKEKTLKSEELGWKEIKRETIIHDEWIDFRKSTYRFPDGSVYEPYYSYSRRDYAVIVATDEDGRYICVRQFRQGIKEITTEFPAGGIERTDGKEYAGSVFNGGEHADNMSEHEDEHEAEDALDAAKRELLEETGYESDEWTHLLTIPSNATISDNYAHIYSARNCRKVSGQDLDDMEFLNVVTHTDEEIEKLIYSGDFKQSVHVMAWLLEKKNRG